MSSIQDYELLSKKAAKKFKELNIKESLERKQAERIGFYYFAFEVILGIKDKVDINNAIIDESYKEIVNGTKGHKDLGIDAVYIDHENEEVMLFNFKYRNEYSRGTTLTLNEIKKGEAFLGYIKDAKSFELDKENRTIMGKDTAKYISEIIELKNNVEASDYNFTLYVVSNDEKSIDKEEQIFKTLNNNYPWLEIKDFNLKKFAKVLAIKAGTNQAEFFVENEELLQHGDSYTTAQSYVVKLKLNELLKLTSDNLSIREDKGLEDIEIIENLDIDLNVLFDNVRGYLGDTDFNKNILTTLKNEPEKFFLFNNGMTMTVDNIEVRKVGIKERYKVILKDYQVVNGGQTLRTIYKFINENPKLISNLAKANILLRIFKTSLEDGLVNKVAEFTNSQNSIDPIDLKSVDSLQLDIENHFYEEKIRYIRKRSADSSESEEFDFEITMEKLGQSLLAYLGFPEKVSNNKKKIFSNYYDRVFNRENKFMSQAILAARNYNDILKVFQEHQEKEYYEQKVFYVIYMLSFINDKKIVELIDLLNENIELFRKDEKITPSRKLLQKAFKELLDDRLKKLGYIPPEVSPLK